ncbi:MAG: S8 family peptidase [Lachnospiraceae bacterium]|jgi:serine protease AprX|nr:S8 family peptidase [Lachnospiraceae bacterium]
MFRVRKQLGCHDRLVSTCGNEGVTVAVLDTGIGNHPDFENRVIAFRDFLNGQNTKYDDSGHGTHVAGCIAGNGAASNGKYKGMAPLSRLVVGKVLNHKGDGNIEEMIDGIHWVLENKSRYDIRVLNISIGMSEGTDKDRMERLLRAVDEAWMDGLVVVCAAGNMGPELMSLSPIGTLKRVITVGCNEGGYFGNREYLCENYSGRGPSPHAVKKPDVVAPGTDIVSCNLYIERKGNKYRNGYIAKSGTSMATPIVTGGVALLLQKYPYFNNEQAKKKLQYSATDLKQPWSKQGYGMMNVERMLGL